jgi:ketosteroid isomerase-like protein
VTPSRNLDLVRSIYADWERGEFSSAEWADREIEFVLADGPEPGSHRGIAAMADAWSSRLSPFDDYRVTAGEYRELDEERILVFLRQYGRGRSSGLVIDDVGQSATVFHVRNGRVTRMVLYVDSDRALADLGLAPGADSPEP